VVNNSIIKGFGSPDFGEVCVGCRGNLPVPMREQSERAIREKAESLCPNCYWVRIEDQSQSEF